MQTRWGILGLGSIANKFAEGLKYAPGATLAAVGSRNQAKADEFAQKHGAERAYGNYQSLAEDPSIDAVYIATPHPMHKDDALLCLRSAKAVLCEKPFAVNAQQAQEMITYARDNSLFLMEAMWTRFNPTIARARDLVAEKRIGELQMVVADFGFRADFDPKSRLFNPALGGGALLDVGVYPISLATMLLGAPESISGTATLGESGVDENDSISLRYSGGAVASLSTSLRTTTPHAAHLLGSKGSIEIKPPFWVPKELVVRTGDGEETISSPFEGNGYQYQAMEVDRCLEQGLIESQIMPLDETLSIMRIMDELRRQWGVVYPMEKI